LFPERLDFVGLIETRGNLQPLGGLESCGYRCVGFKGAVGLSGGLEVWIKKGRKGRLVPTFSRRLICLDTLLWGKEVRVAVVYGSSKRNENVMIVAELQLLFKDRHGVILGDFNSLRLSGVEFDDWYDIFAKRGAGKVYTWRRFVRGIVRRSRIDFAWSNVSGLACAHSKFFNVGGVNFSDHKMIRVWHDSGKGDKSFNWKFPVWILVRKGDKERIRGMISRYSARGWRYIVGRIRKATTMLIDSAISEGIEKDAVIRKIKENKGLLGEMRPNRYSSAKFGSKLRDPVSGRMVWEDICDYIKCQYDDIDGIEWLKKKGEWFQWQYL